ASDGGSVRLMRQEFSATLDQVIFDGFFRSSLVKERQANLELSREQLRSIRNAIALGTAEAYQDVLKARAVVAIYQDSIKSHQKTLSASIKRVKSGAGGRSEVHLAASRLQLAQSKLQDALSALDAANNKYQEYTGSLPPAVMEPPVVPATAIPKDFETVWQTSANENPSLLSAQEKVAAAEARLKETKAVFMPTVSLDGADNRNNELEGVPGPNDSASIMLRVKYNLFAGGTQVEQYKTDHANYIRAQFDLEATHRELYDTVSTTWDALQVTTTRMPYLQGYQDQSHNVFLDYSKEYRVGQRSLFDVLNAENEYYSARVNYLTGYNEWLDNHYRLLAIMGKLDTAFNGQ
ncbi:MAG: TolC family protein, partial [Gammaproteobacteria bacterium]|nr:TolC family protein [Gammaproteobacteria bacterium]